MNTLLTALKLLPDGGGKLISGDGRGDPYEGLYEVVFVQGEALSSSFTLQNKKKSAGAKPSDQLPPQMLNAVVSKPLLEKRGNGYFVHGSSGKTTPFVRVFKTDFFSEVLAASHLL